MSPRLLHVKDHVVICDEFFLRFLTEACVTNHRKSGLFHERHELKLSKGGRGGELLEEGGSLVRGYEKDLDQRQLA